MKYFRVLLLLLSIVSCNNTKLPDGVYADIETNKGHIVVALHYKDTPLTVENFISLAEGTSTKVSDSLKGKEFYNGLPFHRVIPNFMIQGGDIKRNGAGSPGYTFEDEFPKDSLGNLLYSHNAKGIMSMANTGPNSNGSQFFITHKETPWLDGKHTVFGKVVEGVNIVDSIQQGDKIVSIEILRKGREAKNFSYEKAYKKLQLKKKNQEKLAKEKRSKDSIQFSLKMEEFKAEVLPSGLKILKIKEGTGSKVSYGDKVKVHYTGYFVDGEVFDTSKKRNKPLAFTLGVDGVIEGWTEGITLVRKGGIARLFIPYHLAYGERGYGPIPEKSNLIFDIEIVK